MTTGPDALRPVAVDLFSGAGGLSLGLEQAGFDVAAAVEYDPIHAATHEFNFPGCATICGDVTSVTADTIRGRANLPRPPDLVAGGPPCQGFSMIGKRDVADLRNDLVMEFERIVVDLGARYFLMENVPGMLIGAQRGILDEVVGRFELDGYTCLAPFLLTASDYGVPQNRTRMFLIGARRGEKLPSLPPPNDAPCPTVWDAIGDLPEVEHYPELLVTDEVAAKFGEPSAYAAELRELHRARTDRGYRRQWDPEMVTSSARTIHTALSVRRFSKTRWGRVEPVSRFLRLDPAGRCNTLRAGTDGKRGAYTSPRPIHPETPRVITVREAARLHSFPDWFRFHVTKWHGFRQVGNAVVPFVSRAVGREIVDAMGARPKRPRGRVIPGDPELLRMTMTQAADYYGVPADVVGTRDRR